MTPSLWYLTRKDNRDESTQCTRSAKEPEALSRATAYRHSKYARAWLRDALSGAESGWEKIFFRIR
jgi:hypothetical protein